MAQKVDDFASWRLEGLFLTTFKDTEHHLKAQIRQKLTNEDTVDIHQW